MSPIIVGAACDVIGAIGRLNPLPINESDKLSLVKKLLSISFNSAVLSKVKCINKIKIFIYLYFYYKDFEFKASFI